MISQIYEILNLIFGGIWLFGPTVRYHAFSHSQPLFSSNVIFCGWFLRTNEAYNPNASTRYATDSHCAFSSNLFHGQTTQIIHRPSELSRKDKKISHLKFFWNKTTLRPLIFSSGEEQEAQMRGCGDITLAQK